LKQRKKQAMARLLVASLLSKGCEGDRTGRKPRYLMKKVNAIIPAEAAFYTSGNSNMIKREEIVFIDLRRKVESLCLYVLTN
jgi:hypothetical protein